MVTLARYSLVPDAEMQSSNCVRLMSAGSKYSGLNSDLFFLVPVVTDFGPHSFTEFHIPATTTVQSKIIKRPLLEPWLPLCQQFSMSQPPSLKSWVI
jgi:hypothetical protein